MRILKEKYKLWRRTKSFWITLRVFRATFIQRLILKALKTKKILRKNGLSFWEIKMSLSCLISGSVLGIRKEINRSFILW